MNLSLMKEALGRLGNVSLNSPEKTILVAGTNGKGSVCASLEALLLDAGQSVGLFTSPHLSRVNERFRINQQEVSDSLFSEASLWVEQKTIGLYLTYFETMTLIAIWLFHLKNLDWMIFEVGMGGTYDATNALPHRFSAVARLGLDHEEVLGSDLSQIAAHKFGIASQRGVLVYTPFLEELNPIAEKVRQETQSSWFQSVDCSFHVNYHEREPLFILESPWGEAELALPGKRGVENAALALTLFEKLGFDPKSHLGSLKRVFWPCRMERVFFQNAPCPLYFSGDHNPQGVQSLIELLSFYPRKKLYFLVGIQRDKKVSEMLDQFLALADSFVYLTENSFDAKKVYGYENWLNQVNGFHPDPYFSLKHLFSIASPEDMIVVTGSLYLVGCLRKFTLPQV